MKQIIYVLTIAIFVLLCCSCNMDKYDVREPDYSVFEHNNADGVLNDNNIANTNESEDEKPDTAGSSAANMAENNDADIDVFNSEFNGFILSDGDYKYGNLGINNRFNISTGILVCPDPDNDIVYFINEGADNYIYKLENGEKTLVVEMEACNLQLWENRLYYISRREGLALNRYIYIGDLYCYDLDMSETKLVYNKDIINLYIDNDGIFFTTITMGESSNVTTLTGYRMGFDETNPQKAPYSYYLSYKNLFLINTKDGSALINKSSNEEKTLMHFGREYVCSIHEGTLYYTKDSYVYTLNLETGEGNVYDVNDCENKLFESTEIMDFTIINDDIYVIDGGSDIYVIDMNSGNVDFRYVEGHLLNSIYTDGKRLFAVVSNDTNTSKKLVELVTSDMVLNFYEIKELGR